MCKIHKNNDNYNCQDCINIIMSEHEKARNEDIAKHKDNWKKWENDFEHE